MPHGLEGPVTSAVEQDVATRVPPIGFTLTSERGADPVYAIKPAPDEEKLVLMVETSRDSHLYCFYKQADGGIMRIFPNRYHNGSLLRGGKVLGIPGPTMGFEWPVGPPAGAEQVKCYAVDRDIAEDLPVPVRETDFEVLPYTSLAEVTAVFRSLPNAAVAEASMVITVEE